MFISHILNNHDAAIFDTNVRNGATSPFLLGITNDQSQTDDQLLTYEYNSGADQTIVTNEAESFEFKLSGNIALNANDFDFIV